MDFYDSNTDSPAPYDATKTKNHDINTVGQINSDGDIHMSHHSPNNHPDPCSPNGNRHADTNKKIVAPVLGHSDSRRNYPATTPETTTVALGQFP